MSNACTPILVCVTSTVLEILLPSKTAKFPFLNMDHGHQKIQWIGIGSKKFMQVGIDVRCMHTNFGGSDLSGSEILLPSKTTKFPFLTMDYYNKNL